MNETNVVSLGHAESLKADCGKCVGLCCVALAFARSADFAFEKEAGEECVNLQDDFRCGIHPALRERGFKGCTVFDCFGAGQKVTQSTFNGGSWRDSAEVREPMFAVFPIMRQLHEMLWYLSDAALRPEATHIRADIELAYARVERLTEGGPADILTIGIDAVRDDVNAVLARVSECVRAGSSRNGPSRIQAGADLIGADLIGADLIGADLIGADLIGADLAHHDLRGANLRGALLIAADLRGADLRQADVIGADFRDADVRGATLSTALYLTQFQVSAANGDAETTVPAALDRPAHWASAAG